MKNFKYLILSTAAVLFSSCSTSDFLDEKPPIDTLLDQAFTNENELKGGINGLYNALQSTNSYGGAIPTLSDLLADQAFVSINNSNRFALTRQTTLSFYVPFNGDIGGIWSSLYATIMNANNVLAQEGKIADDPDLVGTPEDYFAQAKAIRAMCYLDLITLFAEYPGGADQDLGVPIHTDVQFGLSKPRATVAEVYDLIFQDLTAAKSAILSPTGQRKKMTLGAVNILLSRYYLAKKDYVNANLISQEVLDDPNSTLLASSQVINFWTAAGEASNEIIFELDYNSVDLPGSNDAIIATWYSGGTYKQNFATKQFYDSFATSDVRRNRWYSNVGVGVDLNTYPDTPKPIDVRKYVTNDKDVVVMRKTEAIFNQLEALYYTDPATALTKLNAWVSGFRQTGYAFAGGTGPALLTEILNQKNKEFLLEGFRYRDLKRNGIGFTNPQTGVTLSPSNYQFQAFPIPQGEMNTNTLMVQNPGYQN